MTRSRHASVLLAGTATLLACVATTALGEPPMSPDAVDRARRYFYVALAACTLALMVLSALSGGIVVLFARRLRTRKGYLVATAVSFVVLTAVGLVTKVIPAIVLFAGLVGAGRTM